MPNLGEFEGRAVTKTTISVRNAGDGLSQAMKVDPQLLHQSDTVYVVMECKVGPVQFDPIKDSETECERKHVLRAGAATIVDADLVKGAVAAMTEKIIAKREEERGLQQMDSDTLLSTQHAIGQHEDAKVTLCPDCYPPGEPKPKRGASTANATRSKVTPIGAAKSAGTKPKKSASKSTAKKSPAKKS